MLRQRPSLEDRLALFEKGGGSRTPSNSVPNGISRRARRLFGGVPTIVR
jgi:hypothetical protein